MARKRLDPVTLSALPIMICEGKRPQTPRQSAFSRRFWDRLATGVFETTFCLDCKLPAFPPRPFCPHCWSERIEWRRLSGRGRLYSQTRVHAAASAFAHEAPYRLALVDLDEGLRVATKFVSSETTALDSVVELVVLSYRDGPLFGARAIDKG